MIKSAPILISSPKYSDRQHKLMENYYIDIATLAMFDLEDQRDDILFRFIGDVCYKLYSICKLCPHCCDLNSFSEAKIYLSLTS